MRTRFLVAAAILQSIVLGCGGGGSSSRDHGAPSEIYPAPHASLPLLVVGTGGAIVSPRLTAITFAGDPLAPFVEDFVGTIGASSWWNAAGTGDYDVGPATATTAVHVATAAPGAVTDAEIQSWLVTQLSSSTAGWPAPTANSLYVLFYPAETTVTSDAGASCQQFAGYHRSVTVNSQPVAYVVVPRCDGRGVLSTLDEATVEASRQMINAVTDPMPVAAADWASPGWSFRDQDAAWTLAGPEVADVCTDWSEAAINVG
ncbi:MAG TPA: hypothetical protein VMV18_02230, partial [bacterium]|nr:hypothetical protein [bacterium]